MKSLIGFYFFSLVFWDLVSKLGVNVNNIMVFFFDLRVYVLYKKLKK